jgi:hypothetical protein
MLCEIDGCLKCTFSYLITLKKQKGSPSINKYCQQCLLSFETRKKCPILLLQVIYCPSIIFFLLHRIRGGNQGVVDTDEAEVDLLMETVSQHLLNTMNINMQNMALVGVNTLYGSFFFNGKVIMQLHYIMLLYL